MIHFLAGMGLVVSMAAAGWVGYRFAWEQRKRYDLKLSSAMRHARETERAKALPDLLERNGTTEIIDRVEDLEGVTR